MIDKPMSDDFAGGYRLTIAREADGSYVGRLDSSDGDLWTDLQQQPQQGDQFKRSLLAFAERYGIPVRLLKDPA
ncbi:hypothetical protein [uncultured Enterovirga sp.]|uniref:hypothetical protein n=1 Tax=uncultured Enterovirga sp. TaxID=2026352 RepID=UPI0035CB9BC7